MQMVFISDKIVIKNQTGAVMLSRRTEPSGNKVRISFETSVEIARCLKDLVKYYKMPIANVLEALICYDHESIKLKDEPPNEFVQEPHEIKW